ncbi:MAG: ABC transporter permease [Gemmatimonadetes bacterium]|nr:ABC transporter permease [Gemmatimonadota bacterium]
MLARTSLRELRHRPLRTALALTGVAVATAMLVDMLMLGGGIQRSFEELLRSRGYELRLSPRGTLPFDTEATISGYAELRDALASVPEVAGVAPVLAYSISVETTDSPDEPQTSLRALALGIDPREQGLLRLLEGELPGSGEVLLDRRTIEETPLSVGDTVDLRVAGGLDVAARSGRARVSGIAEFVFSAREDRPIALPLEDLQSFSEMGDVVSFAMVRLTDGSEPDRVRADITARIDRVEVTTLTGIVTEANERLSYFRQLALILGSVSLVVTALLVGTIMAVSISERLGTIAALRAIGIPRMRILRALTAESLALCALAGLAGLGLGVVVAGVLEDILSDFPGLPQAVDFFVMRPSTLLLAYLLLLLVGAGAGLVPAWRATGLEVASLLHAEEP